MKRSDPRLDYPMLNLWTTLAPGSRIIMNLFHAEGAGKPNQATLTCEGAAPPLMAAVVIVSLVAVPCC